MVLECGLNFQLFLYAAAAAASFFALHLKQWPEPQVVRPVLPPHFCHPCREGSLISSDSMSEVGTFLSGAGMWTCLSTCASFLALHFEPWPEPQVVRPEHRVVWPVLWGGAAGATYLLISIIPTKKYH